MTTEENDNAVEKKSDPPFSIPESAHGPLRDLVEMKAEDFDALVSGLKTAEPSLSNLSLSRHIARVASQVPRSVINAIVSEIMILEYLKQDTEMLPDEFAEAISESAIYVADDDFKFGEDDAAILTPRLTAIFSSDQILELNTKAISVLTDHDNLFLSAKILTDARPVFNGDGSKIEAFAVVHMMRIHTEQNQSHKDFFVAMDEGDIPKIREALDRAEKKASVLKEALKSTRVAYLEIPRSTDVEP